MPIRLPFLAAAISAAIAGAPVSAAAEPVVTFTRIHPEETCRWASLDHLSEEEKAELMGNSAVCDGLPGYPVHFAEYDLRQFTAFGEVGEDARTPGGFAQFNRIGDKVEWRSEGGVPYATILRWFIENQNDEGMPDSRMLGQVLVISTVAQPGRPLSCPAGYVDARANRDANALAREVADRVARDFTCGSDRPRFHGERGKYSGDPTELAE